MKKVVSAVIGLFDLSRVVLAFATVCVVLLTSCASNQGVYKFSVLLYDNPVDVSAWKYDVTQSGNPEGAALNIIIAMQQGDMSGWLASWEPSVRPSLTANDQQVILQHWQPLKNDKVFLVGRVVAGTDVIVEVSAKGLTSETFKFPLKHLNDQWRLTSMDPASDYLNWESSTNKIVEQMKSERLQAYSGRPPKDWH